MADLIFKLFSLQKGSMRAWRWHRIAHALWLLPLFTGLLVWNNIALALDWLFFPGFQNQEVKRPVFVVSLPRTGTTNVLHALNSPGMPFSSMALWECLIAPSVIQRKVLRWMWRWLPLYVRRLAFSLDKRLFSKLNAVHNASLFWHEEDELVLMWSLSTIYVGLFYPESDVLRDLYSFDESVSEKRKARITRRYRRLVQRHLYAIGASSDVRFLSKNPAMAGKVQAIAQYFPDAQALVIERPPNNILPSTELLVSIQLETATDVPVTDQERLAIYGILEGFRHNLQKQLVERGCLPYKVLSFSDLVQKREESMNALLGWLDCPVEFSEADGSEVHRSNKRYVPLNDEELRSVLQEPWPSWPPGDFLVVPREH